MMRFQMVLVAVLLLSTHKVFGQAARVYTLEVQLHSYQNPSHTLQNGHCCSDHRMPIETDPCHESCNNHFFFRLMKGSDMTYEEVYGHCDNITFLPALPSGSKNPLKFEINSSELNLQGDFRIRVVVRNVRVNGRDIVDEFNINGVLAAASINSCIHHDLGHQHGHRLTFSYRVTKCYDCAYTGFANELDTIIRRQPCSLSHPQTDDNGQSRNNAAVIGGVVGAILGAAIIALVITATIIMLLWKKHWGKASAKEADKCASTSMDNRVYTGTLGTHILTKTVKLHDEVGTELNQCHEYEDPDAVMIKSHNRNAEQRSVTSAHQKTGVWNC